MRALRHVEELGAADREVLRHLSMTPARAWSRQALAEATGLNDRTVRDAVSRLASSGIAVLSSSAERGYRLARTADEVERARGELLARITVLSRRARALRESEREMREAEDSGAEGFSPFALALV